MSPALQVVVIIGALAAAVIGLARFSEWSVGYWDRREAARRPDRPLENWAYTPDFDGDEPDTELAALIDWEAHTDSALRVANDETAG